MSYSIFCITGLLAFSLLVPASAWAQTSERHTVEQLEASDLGPFDPVRSPDLEEAAQKIVERTNEFREEQDREKVQVNRTLQKTAQEFAEYMARTDKYGHRADDRTPAERASAQGYEYCMVSENIAYQFKTRGFKTEQLAERFVEGWKDSPRHRENMLERHMTETGVGVAQSESTGAFYAVQMFGRPQSEKIEFRLVNRTETELNYQMGEQQFSLPPRYGRKHTLCQPDPLRWRPNSEQDPRSIEPEDGDEFEVQTRDGQIQVTPMESTAEEASS